MSIRQNLLSALNGDYVKSPVYAVYDWFVLNRQADWNWMFEKGLGRINHSSIVDIERPNLMIEKKESIVDGKKRLDVFWTTDKGVLHEHYIDGWLQEHLVKSANDYSIMQRALSGINIELTDSLFDKSEAELGHNGITLAQFGRFGEIGYLRSPFQTIQIDFAGLERFSIDIALQTPELMSLIEMMNEQLLEIFRKAVHSKARHIKLWENLSIETMGPQLYRSYLIPLYRRIFEIIHPFKKNLHVHYDGRLDVIAEDIAQLPFAGIDSLTPPPEGDMLISRCRQLWQDKFFWLHPTLMWDTLPDDELVFNIKKMVKDVGQKRFCLQISEELPPNWRRTIPLILRTLQEL